MEEDDSATYDDEDGGYVDHDVDDDIENLKTRKPQTPKHIYLNFF